MIRKLIPAALIVSGTLVLTACAGGTANLPGGVNVEVPGVTVPSLTVPNVSDIVNVGIDAQLRSNGFEPNADKSEYTKKGTGNNGDIVLMMENGKPKTVKYNNTLLQCKPTEASVLEALGAGLIGSDNQQIAQSLCG